MSSIVFIVVIGAAILHAAWNALVKGGADKTLSMGAVVIGHRPIAVIALPFVPLPSVENLPYLFTGIGLHFVYDAALPPMTAVSPIRSMLHGARTIGSDTNLPPRLEI